MLSWSVIQALCLFVCLWNSLANMRSAVVTPSRFVKCLWSSAGQRLQNKLLCGCLFEPLYPRACTHLGCCSFEQECTGTSVCRAWGSGVIQGHLCPAFVVMGCDLSPQNTREAGGGLVNTPLGCGDIKRYI